MRCALIGKGHTCDGDIRPVRVVHEPTGKKTNPMNICEEGLRSLTYYLFPAYRRFIQAQAEALRASGQEESETNPPNPPNPNP